jgi:hypothetical protein
LLVIPEQGGGPIAILATNPHNSQPWLFRISNSMTDLYADPQRQIGVIDPFRREMYIGLDCALENMTLAAAVEGYAADVQLLPNPADATHAARLTLTLAAVRQQQICDGRRSRFGYSR